VLSRGRRLVLVRGAARAVSGQPLIIGSVASGWNDAARKGDIERIVHDLATGTTTAVELTTSSSSTTTIRPHS
jgi:hypothetical protein